MLRLYYYIIEPSTNSYDSGAILTLDINKAFDNVTHDAVLKGLQTVNRGERILTF